LEELKKVVYLTPVLCECMILQFLMFQDFKGKLRILSRLSVIYSDAGISQKLVSINCSIHFPLLLIVFFY
jgi:hypothetical protein